MGRVLVVDDDPALVERFGEPTGRRWLRAVGGFLREYLSPL